jgi:O-acetyl-ADP-ribose deacetylase (regulator of RNase III)
MKLLLVHHRDDDLGRQWRIHFAGAPDVEVIEGDICQVACDAVVSPANSFGFMDGGLDYHLSTRFGWDLQERLQRQIASRPLQELLVGEAIVLPTGDAKVPWLISAPTMRVPMRLRQSVNAYLAMKAILSSALAHRDTPAMETIAIPGLGTGCGGMARDAAARQMAQAYRETIRGEVAPPPDFGEAQKRHLQLNANEIVIWD